MSTEPDDGKVAASAYGIGPEAALAALVERFDRRNERFQKVGARARRLNAKAVLGRLVHAAFYASLCQEEGRWATGALLYAGERPTLVDSGWDVQSLSADLSLTPATIAKLSPAVEPGKSFLLVAGHAAALKIIGIGLWPREARRYMDVRKEPPFAVTFSAPGRLLLSTGSLEEVRYERGVVLPETPALLGEEDPKGPWPPALDQIRHAVLGDDFPGWLTDGAVHQLRLAMAEQKAGGILAICGDDDDLFRCTNHARYRLDPPVEFGPLVRREHEAQRASWETRRRLNGDTSNVDPRSLLDVLGAEANAGRAVESAIGHVARLSAMDGAVLLSSNLRVVAVGEKLKVDMTKPPPAIVEADQGPIDTWQPYRLEEHGTRHKSTALWVAEDGQRSAIIVSQDGPAAFVCHINGRLVYWPLTLTSPWFMHPPGKA